MSGVSVLMVGLLIRAATSRTARVSRRKQNSSRPGHRSTPKVAADRRVPRASVLVSRLDGLDDLLNDLGIDRSRVRVPAHRELLVHPTWHAVRPLFEHLHVP